MERFGSRVRNVTTILILADQALTASDVAQIVALPHEHIPDYHVLIPADTERNMFVTLLDSLYIGGVGEAWDALREPLPDAATARRTAQEEIDETVALFAATGAACTGAVTQDDPLPALRAAVDAAAGDVESVVIVTYPLAVEDTFRQDWASKARDALEVPVLHLYRGTSELG